MKASEATHTVYSFSLGFRIIIYISIGVYLALAVGIIYVGLIDRPSPNPNAWGMVGVAVIFLMGGIYSIQIASRLGETVMLTDTHITQNLVNGTQISLHWDEITAFKNRRFLGRLELVSKEPKRVVRLEYQLRDFAALLAEVEYRLAAREILKV